MNNKLKKKVLATWEARRKIRQALALADEAVHKAEAELRADWQKNNQTKGK